MPSIWVRVPLTALTIYVAYVAVACSLQNRLVFPGPLTAPPPVTPSPIPFHGERMQLAIPEGTVEGWFLPGLGASADKPAPVAFFSHGNAETIDDWVWYVDDYLAWGVSVFLIEYRGYGRSAGTTTQEALIEDATAFYDLVVARPDVDRERVVLHGRSLGSGVMCALSRVRPAQLLVLQSAFSHLPALAWQFAVPPLVVHEVFDNPTAVREFPGRVILFHGDKDSLFPLAQAEELRAASPRAQLQVMDCEHNDCPAQLLMTVVREEMGAARIIDDVTVAQQRDRRFLRPKARLR